MNETTTMEVREGEIENRDHDLEVVPTNTAIDINRNSMEDMEWLSNNIGKIAEFQKKIYYGILQMTIPGDFVVFGSGEKERAELSTAACERIARIGISVVNSKMTKEVGRDEKGEFFKYTATGTGTFRGRKVDVLSCVSSRDKFYGRADGKLKDVTEVSQTDVEKAAWRGLMKESVKALLGLRRLDPAELRARGVKMVGSGGHTFQSKSEKAAASETLVTGIAEAKLEKSGKKANGATWYLYKVTGTEGDVFFTFDDKEYAKVVEAQEAKSTVCITYKKNDRNSNEIISVVLAEKPAA